ncbi:ABC transporter substrate-binding protein [Paenarthrobacter nitroguajacolicus]|uniref:ABC transporter substrate-binding protein n=1 Tax=Paenarthrobacter nitroguajacolicus TaxID=211146 RepID=UPI0015C155A5|nr:ABC transporter substrate-binding protein [Paenarthrobacter nitroguajacolicus]
MAEPTTLKVGLQAKLEAFGSVLMADYLGEFKKENLNVEISVVPPNEATLLLEKQHLDVIAAGGNAGAYNLLAAGSSLRLVFPLAARPEDSTAGIYINEKAFDKPLQDLNARDFVGKTVSIPYAAGGTGSAAFWSWLEKLPGGEGISPKDLTWEQLDPPSTSVALINGAIAVGWISPPNDVQIASANCCKLLDDASKAVPVSGYGIGSSLKERGDVTEAFVRALARTTRDHLTGDYRSKPDLAVAFPKVLGIQESAWRQTAKVNYDPKMKMDISHVIDSQKMWREAGLLRYEKDLTSNDAYDPSFLEKLGYPQDH